MNDYYVNQAGTGLGGFSGIRYQKGDGFFGRFVSGTVLPIIKKVLPYLGKTALNTGVDILDDVAKGEKFKESAKRRLRETGERVGAKAMAKVKEFTGTGRRKSSKRRNASKKVSARQFVRRKVKKKKGKQRSRGKKRAKDFL